MRNVTFNFRSIAAACAAALAVGAAWVHAADKIPEPLDYSLLSQTIGIDSLRAGNHDPSGTNTYRFKVTMYGLLNTPEERNLAFEKRKVMPIEIGTFGETKIDALSAWHPDEKAKEVKEVKIDGNQVRELVARMMTEQKAPEADVAVQVEVVMLMHAKKYFVWGVDSEVAKTSYYIVPPTKFDAPFRTNLNLAIADDKGTMVKVAVRYEKPQAAAGGNKMPPKKP